jgi:hypothetical protein
VTNSHKEEKTLKTTVFHTKKFRLVFGRFSKKMAAVRPPIFLCKQFFSTAAFELFCRIFGRLATVEDTL